MLDDDQDPGEPSGKRGLVKETIDGVVDYIRRHDLRVGDEIPGEMNFAQDLGVSRTVIREAFGALSALQLVDIGGGRKAKVGQIDHAVMALCFEHAVRTEQMTIQQIWDVRRALEMRAVVLAAARRTDREAEAICAHAAAMREHIADRPRMARHDIAMHHEIARASRNALFAIIIAAFGPVMRSTITYLHRPSVEETTLVIDQHVRIAESIRDRDPVEATKAMDQHFDWSLRALVASGYN